MGRRPGRRAAMVISSVGALSLLLGLPAAADLDLVGGDTAQVMYTDGDGVNVRTAPAIDSGVLITLEESAPVIVEDAAILSDDGLYWYEVVAETSDGTVAGWVSADYLGHTGSAASDVVDDTYVSDLEAPDDSDSAAAGVPILLDTGGEDINLRELPSLDSVVLTSIPDGAWVEVLEPAQVDVSGANWSLVRYDGVVGYSATAYLGPATYVAADEGTTTSTGAALVDEALYYLGVPYLWGGTTPEGFDCSGLTYVVANRVLDTPYPRSMEEQVLAGEVVDVVDLLPGDFVYFQNTYQWGISHVGIYLGSGQFISASGEHGGVGISSFHDPYWQARYLTARRIG